MKPIHPVFTIMVLSAWLAIADRSRPSEDLSVLGVFRGTTPCGQMIRPLHSVAGEADCALVQWTLTLYQDPLSSEPTTYNSLLSTGLL